MAFAAHSASPRKAAAWVAPAAGVAVGVVLGVVAVWCGQAFHDDPPTVATVAAPAAAAAWPTGPSSAPALPVPAPQRPPAVPAPGPVVTATPASDSVELCGLGRFPTARTPGEPGEPGHPAGPSVPNGAADLQTLPRPVGEEALEAARTAVLARLRQGDAAARATATLLERPPAGEPGAEQAWSSAVLSQARASRSPEVLQWVAQACAVQPEPAACRLALIRTRLELEPDNAAHWAALGEEDPAAAEEAWQGLVRASRWHERPQALALAVEAATPSQLPGYLRAALAADLRERAHGWPSPPEGFVLGRCEQAPPARTEACAALATLMAERSDTLATLTEAASVARAAGWPAERVQQLHEDFQALNRAAEGLRQPPEPWSCRQVHAWQQHLADVGRLGEPAALRNRALPGPASPR